MHGRLQYRTIVRSSNDRSEFRWPSRPPTRPALRERYDRRQREVVDTAARLFAERGYHATSIADLIEATGLASGGLYHYIGSKEQLLLRICDQLMDPLLDEARRDRARHRARRRAAAAARARLDAPRRAPPRPHARLPAGAATCSRPIRAGRTCGASASASSGIVDGLLRDAEDQGAATFADRAVALLALLGMVNYAPQWFQPGRAPERRADRRSLVRPAPRRRSALGRPSTAASALRCRRTPRRAPAAARARARCASAPPPLELAARLVARARASRAGRRARSAAGGSRSSAGSADQRVDQLEPGRRARTPSPTATARLSSTTGERRELGERVVERGDALPVGLLGRAARARGRRRSRPAARTARARRRARSARSSAARPRPISSWSQRARSWSSSRTGSPSGPTRARVRDAWISISATSPWTSGSSRRQLGEDAAEPQRVLAQRRAASSRRRRWPSSPR